jgi:hypothetical protein
MGWKHIRKSQDYCHIVFFSRVPCLNFNHVIIMKDFYNVFAYYGKSKPKEIKCQINYLSYFIDFMLKYICAKNIYITNLLKKCKHIQKMIEMIFNIYEICTMY